MVNAENIGVAAKAILFFELGFLILLICALGMAKYFPVSLPLDRYDEGLNEGFTEHNETVDGYATKYCEYMTLVQGIDRKSDSNYTYYDGYHDGYIRWFIENEKSVNT
ncbi:MAG: hypothetical protein PHN69_07785 [Candidatus Pacebacteria bacterium]|nr:hypothetical protein [Candidatus Paceibacterota bacterium]